MRGYDMHSKDSHPSAIMPGRGVVGSIVPDSGLVVSASYHPTLSGTSPKTILGTRLPAM